MPAHFDDLFCEACTHKVKPPPPPLWNRCREIRRYITFFKRIKGGLDRDQAELTFARTYDDDGKIVGREEITPKIVGKKGVERGRAVKISGGKGKK